VRGHCERCEAEVEVEYDDPQLRRWVKGYFWLGVPFIPLTPIIFSEISVLLPMFMIYTIGMGPAVGILREPALCCECGAAVTAALRK
jgi:hypothetical protein